MLRLPYLKDKLSQQFLHKIYPALRKIVCSFEIIYFFTTNFKITENEIDGEIREICASPNDVPGYDKDQYIDSAILAKVKGGSYAYYDEDGNYYGVYVYGGYVNQPGFNVGNSVVIEGKIGYYFGCLQITDINVKVRAFAPEDPSTTYYVEKIDDKSVINVNNGDLIGSLVTIENLTITGGSNSDTNAFTIYTSYVDSEGKTQKLDIRVSNNVNLVGPDGTRITKYDYFVGKTIKSITIIIMTIIQMILKKDTSK